MFRTSEFLDISKKASVSDWSGHKRRSLTVARGDATCCVFDGWFLNFGGIANSGRPCDVVDAINLRKENTRFQVTTQLAQAQFSQSMRPWTKMILLLLNNVSYTIVMKIHL